MKTKNKILAAGTAALLILGFAAVVNAVDGEGLGMRGFSHAMKRGCPQSGVGKATLIEDLGLPEDATREQIMEARWQKKLSDIGLTEESTVGEFHDAMKAQREARFAERLENIKKKLGLPSDATQEDVKAALEEIRADGEGIGPRGGHGGMRGGCPGVVE